MSRLHRGQERRNLLRDEDAEADDGLELSRPEIRELREPEGSYRGRGDGRENESDLRDPVAGAVPGDVDAPE